MQAILNKGFSLGSIKVYPIDSLVDGPRGKSKLSPHAMQILTELITANGKPVSAEHLILQMWGNSIPDSGTLEHYIAELKHQLNSGDQKILLGNQVCYWLAEIPTVLNIKKSNFEFFAELQRRKVTRTGLLYLVTAWLVIQIAAVIPPALGMGGNVIRIVIITAIVGFPITLLLSWFCSVKRTNDSVVGDSSVTGLIYVFASVLIAIPFAYGYHWYSEQEQVTSSTSGVIDQVEIEPNSIAVLAFLNLSSGNTYDYFGDGVAEEILNALSATGKVLVAPRTSSFVYKDSKTMVKDIGSQLGVHYVLDGSVRRDADRVRVSAQLINVVTGYAVWSNSYDQLLSNIFDVQQDISQQVVRSLHIVLSSEIRKSLGVARTANVEAYDYYLQGRDYLSRPTSELTLDSAIQLFDSAITLDSEYADAYAGLCEGYLAQYIETNTSEWFNKAESACKETLRFDFVTITVRIALGNLYRESGQYRAARDQLAIALRKAPDNIAALTALAKNYLAEKNPQQAEKLFRRAIKVLPRFWKGHDNHGTFLFRTARYTEAVPVYERAAELTPDNAVAYNNLGAALFMASNFEGASAIWQKSLDIEFTESASSNMGSALFFSGRFDEAVDMFLRSTEIAPDRHILWGNLAYAERFSTSPDAAIDHYRRAISLAENALSINPSSSIIIASLAHYCAHTEQTKRAKKLIIEATNSGSKDVFVWFHATLVWLALDNKDVAVETLRQAIELGYPIAMVEADKGLVGLTSDSIYRSLLGL
jgi:TolB-like protein/tetratricopeptide (TPR) repeat protein